MTTCSLSFPYFSLFPVELRLIIWRMAFDNIDPAVSVCQYTEVKPRVSIAQYHAETPRLPFTASVCREVRREWLRLTRRCSASSMSFDRVYVPRTIFLVHASAIVGSRLKGLAPFTAHLAFDAADCPDLLAVFEALASFPHLETIIPIIPSGTTAEDQVSQWQEHLRQHSHLLRRMVALIDEPSPDGEWHQDTFVGWLLRNHLDGERVRRFYLRKNGPRIKLLIDEPGTSGSAVRSEMEPWSLVLY
ncbi:hypothetical protein B0T10DRAFT_553567 [Thelonectria olida]|uniref:2EXR domain-containing protein n=1 Tax=Thelonectria olida TaxID=1576542 RepID=A0A9P8VQS6_9HYPO|nr:hypothetical protein B0T10DRAFT_553567 [Thelonectria olida]